MAERTIIVGGVSKSFAWTGGRVGWAVLPTAEEAGWFRTFNINYFSCVPGYNQHGARVALTAPESAVSIAEMGRAFQERRDVVVDGLSAIEGISCRRPRGAFYVFPNVGGVCRTLGAIDAWESLPAEMRQKSSPATLLQLFLLFRYGVATLDRRSFGVIGTEGKHFLRISIATSMDDLKEAVVRIRTAAADRTGFRSFLLEGRFA
jgi:aspartate/methionine/tyrosine aminotransferase